MSKQDWPTQPRVEEGAVFDTLVAFAKGCLGCAVAVFGVGALVVPNLIEARGATKSYVLEKQRRQRCMELGLTPEQLAELEAEERAAGELSAEDPAPTGE